MISAYNNPNILEIKYEELIGNEIDTFCRIFKHYRFSNVQKRLGLDLAEKLKLENVRSRKDLKNNHIRNGTPGDWKNHFTNEHKKLFKKLYGDLLIKLGYEKDDEW